MIAWRHDTCLGLSNVVFLLRLQCFCVILVLLVLCYDRSAMHVSLLALLWFGYARTLVRGVSAENTTVLVPEYASPSDHITTPATPQPHKSAVTSPETPLLLTPKHASPTDHMTTPATLKPPKRAVDSTKTHHG